MNYWLLALPPEHIEHCIKIGTFGLNRKHIMGRVKTGDKVACYAHKDRKIIGLGEATSDYYVDDKKIFAAEGHFVDRFDFKATRLPVDEEIDFMAVVDRMSFIKNIIYWSAYMRNGIIQISQDDWKTILSQSKTTA